MCRIRAGRGCVRLGGQDESSGYCLKEEGPGTPSQTMLHLNRLRKLLMLHASAAFQVGDNSKLLRRGGTFSTLWGT